MVRSSAPRGVLFDLDGVLIDSKRAWYETLAEGRQRLGYADLSYETFARTFGQGVDADQRDFFPDHTVEQITRLFNETFPGKAAAVEPIEGAHELLETLRERQLRLAVVTNNPVALARAVLAQQKLAPLLDALACAGEAPDKPAPDLIWLALERLRLGRDEVVYVGDTVSDVGAARAAGVRMIGIGIDGDARIERLAELLQHI